MLGPEDVDRVAASSGRKNYLRSISWTDRSPSKPNPRPPSSNNKARLCLPPLQPLSISRRNMEEWPMAGSDDLGVWPSVQTPRGANGEPIKDSENPKPREFQFKRDKLAFFDKECSKIGEHIYLGSDAVAKNREVLRQNGITHVLNCVGFVSPEYFKSDLVYKTLWLQDSPSEDITSILYDVFDYFEDVREQGGRVLVHCCQGVSRSTSLVIAYLMWREGRSFEDSFQHVKAARGVTNPNMGFACQLLQHQKRGNVVPTSPGPVLRMYRMAPHSPYDPLHLVPKLLNEPSVEGLDSRGSFIVHVPSAIYVWIGKDCKSVMSNKAMASAFQVIRYERAQGPILRIKEGEEPSGFWDALAEETIGAKKEATCWVVGSRRRVEKYDLDFEIFHKALAGGIVPPSALSMDSETCLPTRENGWDRLRHKFASGEIKEFVTSAKLKGVNLDTHGRVGTELDDDTTSTSSTPSSIIHPCGSPDSFSCFLNSSSPERIKGPNFVKKDHQNAPFCNSPDSFSCIPMGSPIFSSKSPTLSPSSDYSSSSFTFSPSSSNWSDLPFLSSQQPSPSAGLEPNQNHLVIKDVLSKPNSSCLSHKKESFASNNVVSELEASPLSWKSMVPSLAERRGSKPPTRVLLPSVDEQSHGPKNLVRSWSFSLDDLDDEVMNDVDFHQSDSEGDVESLTLATELSLTSRRADEMQIDNQHHKNCDVFSTCSCTDEEDRLEGQSASIPSSKSGSACVMNIGP